MRIRKKIENKKWTANEAINRIKRLMEDDKDGRYNFIYLSDDSCMEDNFPYAIIKIKIYDDGEFYPTWIDEEFFEFLTEHDKNEFVEFMVNIKN